MASKMSYYNKIKLNASPDGPLQYENTEVIKISPQKPRHIVLEILSKLIAWLISFVFDIWSKFSS